MDIHWNSRLFALYVLFFFFFPYTGHAGDAGKTIRAITVVSDDNYPPYIFRSQNSDIQGILIDEWKLWEKKTGIKVNFIAMDWNKALELMSNGKCDVIDTIFYTKERAKQYDFTKPYAKIEVPVFFHKNLAGIVDIDSLSGYIIGVKAGDACIDVLKSRGINSLREFDSYEEIVQAALDRQIKVFSIDKPPALYYLYKMNYENEFRYSFNLYTGEFHRAVKKGRKDILKMVEDGFALISKKERNAIEKKWMGESILRPIHLRYILFAFLIVGFFFFLLICFNFALRNKIRLKTSELRFLVHQLRLSEERFKSVFDQAAVGVAICDSKNGKYIDVNQRYCDILGYSKQEISQMSFHDITYPDDLHDDLKNLKRLLAGTIDSYTQEKRYFSKDGSIVWVKITISLMGEKSDDSNLHIAVVEDITEHKKADEFLRESEAKYRELAGSLPQIVFETDMVGNLTFVNQNAYDFFGYTEEDFHNGLNAIQMIVPEERDKAIANLQRLLNGEIYGGKESEYTALRKDGSTFPIIIHSNRSMRDNKPVGLRGLIIDLSKSKTLETDLKRRAMAMDQSKETIVITDTQALITYVNPAFEQTSGYCREEALGKNPSILQSGKHDKRFYNELWQTISNGRTWNGILINKRKDGAQYTEEATISPVFSDSGDIISYVAVKRDITEKLKLEAQLQQAHKMEAIGNLAGGIAHDFNNILSPILGYTEMLLLDAPFDSHIRQSLNQILTAANTAKNLVNQILTFSRQDEHEKKPIKVNSVITEALKLVRSSLPTTIDISDEISTDCGLILADLTQIHQIIMNLCTNAYHAMETSGGTLAVSLKNVTIPPTNAEQLSIDPGAYVCLTVSDTGIGMNQGIIDRIFDPYFTTKEAGKGTGLGLSVVHGIVNNHSGYIKVYSEPGKGTEFNVYLPKIKEFGEATQIRSQTIQKGDERILLVDDKKDVADIEQQMLERLGYHVTVRLSSTDALAAFQTNPDSFDLVITDMTMPNMTGDKLACELIKIRPTVPVILCTGFSEMMSKEKAESLGIKGFLMKPVTMPDFSTTIRKVLHKDTAE